MPHKALNQNEHKHHQNFTSHKFSVSDLGGHHSIIGGGGGGLQYFGKKNIFRPH